MAIATAESLQPIQTEVLPDATSWLTPVLARFLAAHRARQSAEIERILRQGLAAVD